MRLTVFSIALLLLVATSSAAAKRHGKKKEHAPSKHKVTQDAEGSSLLSGSAHRKRAGHKGKKQGHKSLSGTVEGLDEGAVGQAAIQRRARRMGRRLQAAAAYHSASAAPHLLSDDPPIPYQPGPLDGVDTPYFHFSSESASASDSSAQSLHSLIDGGDLGLIKRHEAPSSRREAQLYDGHMSRGGFKDDGAGGGSGSEGDFKPYPLYPFDSYSGSEDEGPGRRWDPSEPFTDSYYYFGDDMYSFENPDVDLSFFHEQWSDGESDTVIPPFPSDPAFWRSSGSDDLSDFSDWDEYDVEETTIADAASRFTSSTEPALKPSSFEPHHVPHSISNLPVVDSDSSDAVEDFFLTSESDSAAHAAAGAAGVAPPEAAAWEATLQLGEPSLAEVEVGHEHLHSASAELEVDENLWEIEGSPAEIALALRVLASRTSGHVGSEVHVTLSGPATTHMIDDSDSADPSGAASPGRGPGSGMSSEEVESAILENQRVLAAKIERLTIALDRTLTGLKRFVWWHGITLITFGAILLIVTALYLLGGGGHSDAEPLLDRPLFGSRNKSHSSASACTSDGEPGPGDVVLCPQKSLPRVNFTKPLVKVTSFTPDMRSAGFPTPAGSKPKLSSWVSWPRSFVSKFVEYRSASAGAAEGRVPLQLAESARDHNEELFADLLGGGSPCDSDEDERAGGKAEGAKA